MTHDLDSALSGILVTPYDADGDIAPERLAPILDRALGAGVHMPVVNGNTGEFYALTTDEACTMVREVADLIGDRAPLLAGVGRGLRDACRLAKASADAGAAALMIHQPPDPFVAPPRHRRLHQSDQRRRGRIADHALPAERCDRHQVHR